MNIGPSIHPALLVHWTGKDIDEKWNDNWYQEEKSETKKMKDLESMYVDRLLSILNDGLWMTKEEQMIIDFGDQKCIVPPVIRICFTELRLSQSRTHAQKFGRLGIAVKRPFLFKRGGRPVIYYGHEKALQYDLFFKKCAEDLKDKSLLHFFKAMKRGKTFEFYDESEWRILFSKELENEKKVVLPDKSKGFQNCEYLIPLDGWLSAIIYPSISIKNKCIQDTKIREAIGQIKRGGHANIVEGGNWPIELDLDMCRNF